MSLHALYSGVDEAGRGSLAGPVTASAVILDPAKPIVGLKDSKLLSSRQRELLTLEIKVKSIAWCVAEASVLEIEKINILEATMLAMQRSVQGLQPQPMMALIDGNRCPKLDIPTISIIKADRHINAVSAASILAKTSRDAKLCALAKIYPEYGFEQNKGYGVKYHLQALTRNGPCQEHRHTYKPVRLAKINLESKH